MTRLRMTHVASWTMVLVLANQVLGSIFDHGEEKIPSSLPNNIFEVPNSRIVGGFQVAEGEFPGYVHSAPPATLCGGSLITPDVVLTAAHCNTAFDDTVFVGATSVNGSSGKNEQIGVRSRLPHPEYIPGPEHNNIMLVLLDSPSTAPVIPLNFDPSIPAAGDEVTVIGFGLTNEGGEPSKELLQVQLTTISFDDCDRLLPASLENNMTLCAGYLPGGKDSCEADGGGPLMDSTTGVQFGIVSFGVGCAREDKPSVYTRVSSYKNWISGFVCNNSATPGIYCGSTPSPTLDASTGTQLPSEGSPSEGPLYSYSDVPHTSFSSHPAGIVPSPPSSSTPTLSPINAPILAASLTPAFESFIPAPSSRPEFDVPTYAPASDKSDFPYASFSRMPAINTPSRPALATIIPTFPTTSDRSEPPLASFSINPATAIPSSRLTTATATPTSANSTDASEIVLPTDRPVLASSQEPSSDPSMSPTETSSAAPTELGTNMPSGEPSLRPTAVHTRVPSVAPSFSSKTNSLSPSEGSVDVNNPDEDNNGDAESRPDVFVYPPKVVLPSPELISVVTIAPTPTPVVRVALSEVKVELLNVGLLSPEDIDAWEQTMEHWFIGFFLGDDDVENNDTSLTINRELQQDRRRDARSLDTRITFMGQGVQVDESGIPRNKIAYNQLITFQASLLTSMADTDEIGGSGEEKDENTTTTESEEDREWTVASMVALVAVPFEDVQANNALARELSENVPTFQNIQKPLEIPQVETYNVAVTRGGDEPEEMIYIHVDEDLASGTIAAVLLLGGFALASVVMFYFGCQARTLRRLSEIRGRIAANSNCDFKALDGLTIWMPLETNLTKPK